MRLSLTLALAGSVALVSLPAAANSACDDGCWGGDTGYFISPSNEVEPPLNVQLLVDESFGQVGLEDRWHNPVPVRIEPAGQTGGADSRLFQWIVPEVELEPEREFFAVLSSGAPRGSFVTGTERDDEPPEGVELDITAYTQCGSIVVVEALVNTSNETEFVVRFDRTAGDGVETRYSRGEDGRFVSVCFNSGEAPLDLTVTVYDLAGHGSEPQQHQVVPNSHLPEEEGSGCSLAPAGGARQGATAWGLALLLAAARFRCRRKPR